MLNSESKVLLSGRGASLANRAAGVAVVLVAEKSLLNRFVDFNAADVATGFAAFVRAAQHFGLRFLVTVALALALFGLVSGRSRLAELNSSVRGTPLRLPWVAAHGLLLAALIPVLSSLYQNGAPAQSFALQATLLAALAAGAFLTLLATAAPLGIWQSAARSFGVLWIYALSAGLAATVAIQWTQALWTPMASVTYEIVRELLLPLIPQLRADPPSLVLSTQRFAVQISDECSGLEGMGLMLAFCCAWLVYFRQEYRFPRALLLVPAALVVVFVLNVLRICALILLGDAGYPEVASVGFHSQAGWIAFNIAACGVAIVSRRIPWLMRNGAAVQGAERTENPTASYVMPFLALLAAGMIARAASSGFEFLYAIRLLIAVPVLCLCWPRLRTLDWRLSWRGPLIGVLVFLLWMLADRLLGAPGVMPDALAATSATARLLWIAGRIATAVLLVPVAEELAYRGFLLRRLVSADFESVRFQQVGWLPLLASSVLFGLGHGTMSVAGIAAGVLYGGLLVRTGRMGEAASAHATTNLLIAVAVLVFGQWQLW